MQNETDVLVKVEDAAAMLGVSVAWLNKARSYKRGPKFYRIGRMIRYSTHDLMEFVREGRG